ncbi:RB-associated KRAB zinc finger protein-like isoform X1 [Pleurodeles waltl]
MTFRDVAACFSKEEWKLLDEWQNELYRNVMKEIQQVLTSLGPLIAASVFSLSVKENDALYSMDQLEPGTRHNVNHSPGNKGTNPDNLYRMNGEELEQWKDPQNEVAERNECLSTEYHFLSPDICLRKEGESGASLSLHIQAEREALMDSSPSDEIIASDFTFHIKEEGVAYPLEHEDSERTVDFSSLTSAPFLHNSFDLQNEEEEPTVSLRSQPAAEAGESSTASSSGHAVIPEVVVVRIKEEGDVYPSDSQDCEIIESTSSPNGIGNMNKKATIGESTENVPRNTKYRTTMWSEDNWKKGTEKIVQHERGFIHFKSSNSNQPTPKPGRLDKCKEHESKLRSLEFFKSLPSTLQNPRIFRCTVCDKSYGLKGELIRHMITHSGIRPYPCTECGKSFFQMPHLIRHHRTHSGEKPYSCSFCHKRFNRKDNLNGHERIHTGERPYKCSECEKRFIRKSDLNEHRRKHF